MKLFNEKNIGKLIILNSCLIGLLMWLGIVAHTLWDSRRNAKQDLLQLEENYINAKKNSVRLSVNDFITRMDTRQQLATLTLRRTLQEQVQQIHTMASSLYEQNKDTMGRKELEKLIVEAIRPLRFNNNRGYFFIRSLAGVSRLYPPNPLREGRSIHANATVNRLQVFDGLVDVVRNQGCGFYEYLWPKPGEDKEQLFQKISYVCHFAPFAWYIGAGDYVAKIKNDIKENVITILNQPSQLLDSEYIFILDLHNIEGGKDFATMLINPNRPDLLGKLLSDAYQDANGKEFRKEFLAGLRQHGEVFVKYWYKKPGTAAPLPKMSYFKLYPEWNWIVARGFYFDDLSAQITARQEQQQEFFKEQIYYSLAVLCCLLLGAMLISLFFSQKVRTLFQAYRSRLEQSNKDLKRAGDKARAATIAKSEFLANMSHEIRTPMNAIMGLTELALEAELNAKQADYLLKIKIASSSLLGIINDILDSSKMESGKLHIEQVDFSPAALITAMSLMFSSLAREKKLELFFDLDNRLPRALQGDPNRLSQILINLLSNAVKFTEKGQVKMLIEQLDRDSSTVKVKFSVSDSGIGLEKDFMDKIFDSFAQADASTTRKYGGTGLGLSICKQLVELMGGAISVESVPERGSVFSFILELAMGDESRLKTIADADLAAEAAKTSQDAASLRGQRILLVEDDEINQQVALEKLKKFGMIIDLAVNGREAVRAVQAKTYDAILMDIQMPVLNGYEATVAIREQEAARTGEGRHLPIIAMSANAMPGDMKKSLQAGMDDHINKPIDTRLLHQTLLRRIDPSPGAAIITAASDAAVNADILPDSLPGLALNRGLKNLDGNAGLYRKLLNNFLRDYEEAATEIKTALGKDDRQKARLLAHTIKGVAGNLGAFDLQKAASLLEEALGANDDSSLDELLYDFNDRLQRVMASLKSLPKPDTDKPQQDVVVDIDQVRLQLANLDELLQTNNFQAVSKFTQLKSPLQALGLSTELKKIEKYMDKFAFHQARDELVLVQQRIKETVDGRN